MANRVYVDIDLYGRGFDGIFGPGAEEENRRQALMKFQAMRRFKERVKPGEYIDLDLYGRGDPRVFGLESHIHIQNEAQKHLEEAQRRKRERCTNPLAVVFPPGIKAIARFAKDLLQRRSSSRTEERDVQEDVELVDDNHSTEDKVARAVEHDPEEGIKHSSEIHEPLEETSTELVDRTPKRVKSKLPSEEVRPHVEKGHVLRAIKSFSSFDKVDNRTNAPGNVVLAELARLEKHSSLPIRGNLLPVVSHSGPNKEVQEAVQDHEAINGASDTEDEVAKGILDGDDEECQLSFSAPPQTVVEQTPSDSPSTSSEQDLVARKTELEHAVLDGAGRSVAVSKNIRELFRSGDTDSCSEPEEPDDAADDPGVPGDDSRVPENSASTLLPSSSTEDVQLSENIVPVTGLSFDAIQISEDASHSAFQSLAEENNDISIDSRGDSIIKLVETPDISFNDHSQHFQHDDFEDTPNEVEVKGVSTPVARAVDNAIMEIHERNAEIVVHEGSSNDESSSTAEDDENDAIVEDAGNEQHSESTKDSDRSAEAESSSEVMTSSPEEDSDNVDEDSSEIGTEVALVEDSDEVDDVEDTDALEHEEREISDSDTAESSDRGGNLEDDAGGHAVGQDNSGDEEDAGDGENNGADDAPRGEEETKTFWQRLGLFGAVITGGSWMMS